MSLRRTKSAITSLDGSIVFFQASEEDKPEMDLFRAIFRNTDSEDSSSSDEEEKLENSVPVSTETGLSHS